MPRNKLIENHPTIGHHFNYTYKGKTTAGTVTAVRRADGFLFNVKPMKEIKGAQLVELRLEPDDGSRAFWTRAMKDVSTNHDAK